MNKKTSNHTDAKKHKNISRSKSMTDQDKIEEMQEQRDREKDIQAENPERYEEKTEVKSVSPEEELNKKLENAEQESRERYDKYLRLSAEFDNYRKRTLKEKADLLRFANEDLLKGLLPVIDDFERGIDNIEKSTDIEALKAGVVLIYNKFREFIKQNGLKEIEAINLPFNVDLHEAVTAIPTPSDDMKGKILDVIEKGYTLNDKVIRFAKIVLGE